MLKGQTKQWGKNKIPGIDLCIYRFLNDKMARQKGKHNFTINVAEHTGFPGEVGLTLKLVIHHSKTPAPGGL